MADPPADLAAEYVLGILSPADWVEARGRLATDALFAAEVAVWEARLTPLILAAEAISPTQDLWPMIRKALPANDAAGAPDGLTFWRGLTAASVFIAVVCLSLVVMDGRAPTPQRVAQTDVVTQPAPPEPEPMQVALLKPTRGPTAFVATLDRSRKLMTVSPGAAPAPKGKSLVLWMIPPGGAPQLLGIIPSDHSAKMPMPDAFAGRGDTPIELAVSVEPKGGSPTGRPTGPVVATGRFNVV
jgi:anti-sigma-K factor RskA